MNTWARKTARIAQAEDYLDRIQKVYPSETRSRAVSTKAQEAVKAAYRSKDKIRLLNVLLDQERFPFDDSYVQFLRIDRGAIMRNPKTVDRICDTLFRMGEAKIIKGVTAPVVANRRRGAQFKQWAKSSFKSTFQNPFS